jgi:hypothetical protein
MLSLMTAAPRLFEVHFIVLAPAGALARSEVDDAPVSLAGDMTPAIVLILPVL